MRDQIVVDGFDAPLDWGKSGIFMYTYINHLCMHINYVYIHVCLCEYTYV
jgi:hypothetical protein